MRGEVGAPDSGLRRLVRALVSYGKIQAVALFKTMTKSSWWGLPDVWPKPDHQNKQLTVAPHHPTRIKTVAVLLSTPTNLKMTC